jgi:hypothetical protein
MPAVASNSFPIAFGAWQRGYTIVDRTGFTVLRDPYTVKGRVQFYVRKRLGGAVRDSNAIKVLKVATTRSNRRGRVSDPSSPALGPRWNGDWRCPFLYLQTALEPRH